MRISTCTCSGVDCGELQERGGFCFCGVKYRGCMSDVPFWEVVEHGKSNRRHDMCVKHVA